MSDQVSKLDQLIESGSTVSVNGTNETGGRIVSATIGSKFNREDIADVNRQVRESSDKSTSVTVKIIEHSVNYGIRSMGPTSSKSKSAARLALDTGVDTPKDSKDSGLRAPEVNRICNYPITDPEKTVRFIDRFEQAYGGRCTTGWRNAALRYNRVKHDVIRSLGITLTPGGKPIFPSDEAHEQYFNAISPYAFSYVEVYVSVKPNNTRATRSRSFKALSIEDLKVANFPSDWVFEDRTKKAPSHNSTDPEI